MPRPRSKDPLGLPPKPNLAATPERERKLTEEFIRRVRFVQQNYRFVRKVIGTGGSFNEDLRLLKNRLAKKWKPLSEKRRIHPGLAVLINFFARDHARTRTGLDNPKVEREDVDAGARKTAAIIKPRRGRPEDLVLRHHVEALMAICQEACGKPAMAQTAKNSVYDPQATNLTGETVVLMAQTMEGSATKTQIVGIMRAARLKYAGKPMRFLDFFPVYGGSIEPDTYELKMRPGWRTESFEINHPIYFR